MEKNLAKYATQAGTGAVLWGKILGRKGGYINVNGMNVPTWAVGAAMGASAALLNDISHDFILPHISKDQKLRHMEAAVVAPSIAGGANLAVSKILNPQLLAEAGMTEVFAYGAISELIAQFIFESFVNPLVNSDFHEADAF